MGAPQLLTALLRQPLKSRVALVAEMASGRDDLVGRHKVLEYCGRALLLGQWGL